MILIFGGTGFVGRNLILRLMEEQLPLRVVSRRPDTAFLRDHSPTAEVVTTEQFYSDPRSVLSDCTSVIYLGSTSTPGSNLDTPWKEPAENVAAVVKAMHMVTRYSDAHFVYLSSGGAIYGATTTETIPEDMPLNPISPYGLGKKMCEAAIDFMARTSGLKYTVLRPANPIGPWQTNPAHGVVGVLFRAAAQKTEFRMLGDGSSVRDYFDIRDLVRGIVDVIENPEISVGKTWNIGSGQGRSVVQIHDVVERVTGGPIAIKSIPSRPTDIDHVVLDISLIRKELGWHPEYDLEETLMYSWTHFN